MKIFIILSVCLTLALGCSDLPKLAACNRPEGDCTCQAGLTCKLTKQIEKMGEVIPIKQCVEEGMDIDIETVDMEDEPDDDDELENSPRHKRWFTNWFKRCTNETDCGKNNCCAFNKRCAPKLFKYVTCSLTSLHKCGCRDGLVCKKTAEITIPIVGTKLSIRQCMPEDE